MKVSYIIRKSNWCYIGISIVSNTDQENWSHSCPELTWTYKTATVIYWYDPTNHHVVMISAKIIVQVNSSGETQYLHSVSIFPNPVLFIVIKSCQISYSILLVNIQSWFSSSSCVVQVHYIQVMPRKKFLILICYLNLNTNFRILLTVYRNGIRPSKSKEFSV